MSASSTSNDLRNRIIFTIGILAVYRFGTFVPLPGIDPEQLKILMDGNQKGFFSEYSQSTASEDMAEVFSHLMIGTNLKNQDSILENKINFIRKNLLKIDPNFIL